LITAKPFSLRPRDFEAVIGAKTKKNLSFREIRATLPVLEKFGFYNRKLGGFCQDEKVPKTIFLWYWQARGIISGKAPWQPVWQMQSERRGDLGQRTWEAAPTLQQKSD
jgi:hypothetical protein